MLLLRCPYCETDRAELEFAYAGEAHIARPSDPSALNDEEWRNFLFIRSNSLGTLFRTLAPPTRLRPLFQCSA